MTVLSDQIAKARRRAAGIDLPGLAAEDKVPPADLASPSEIAERRDFLRRTLTAGAAELALERIIEGNELQPVSMLALGAIAARSVCRIKLFDEAGEHCGWASGFLIAPQVLLTNNHVLPSEAMARRAVAQFDVEVDLFGDDRPMVEFSLEPERLFFTTVALDFAVCAVAPMAASGPRIERFGFLPLIGATGKVVEGEWLTIIQHPGGERKQVCVRENRLLTRTDDVLWYSTDTMGGSSGSPVFNNSWQVVALHHLGVPHERNGRIQTVDGRDFDPGRDRETAIHWIANEGIRVSRIVQTLREQRAGHPLLADVFDMPPDRAAAILRRFVADDTPAAAAETPATLQPSTPEAGRTMMSRSVTVTLDIDDDGCVSIRGAGASLESAWLEKAASKKPSEPEIDVPFDFDYGKREGYRPDFLGNGFVVHAPDAGGGMSSIAARLLDAKPKSKDPADFTLKYTNYSVMMHRQRRLALWTAASIDGGNRFKIGRTSDTWRYDPRIEREAQLGNFYYKNNDFDRGHLTRREDMEYGSTLLGAVAAADDTCHWSNCAPQHSKFNQLGYVWQNLEQHILEGAIRANRFGAQVFTGPVLDEGDPRWDRFPEILYPTRYWKVAVALTSENKLFAAGFVLDQSQAIADHGIEAAVEIPFAPFLTYQTPIAEIEDLTGLTFWFSQDGEKRSLRDVDPLGTPQGRAAAARRARRGGNFEATSTTPATPPGYVLLSDPGAIIR